MSKVTKEEVNILKKIAQEHITFNKVFMKDKHGKEIPRGNYSDYVKAMKNDPSSLNTRSGKQ